LSLRFPDELVDAVDLWAAKQKDAPSRSEAIRRLVELALKKGRHNARLEDSQPEKAARGERTWRGRRRAEERKTMPQDEARRLVLADWRALPEEKRMSNTDRLLFAMKAAQKYPFKCSGDPYQTVMSWLEHETPGNS
jgi:Arc/MetJ-type ribon-helix-helix transcriptional regulator